MRYWITTHWPHLVTEPSEHRHVYLQQQHRAIGERFDVGDRILIYESVSGQAIIKHGADGSRERVRRRRGIGGLVADTEVAERIAPRSPGEGNVEYADGRTANWAWIIKTQNENYAGFVPRVEVLRVLGYSLNWNMHGFGEESSGVKELFEPQYNELVRMFRATPRP